MKKALSLVLCALLLGAAAATTVSAYDGENRLTVEAGHTTATVDGVLDEGYGPLYTVEQEGVAHTPGLALTTGKVAVAWDESKLYFYCEVYDNNEPWAVSMTDWQCDGPEFFIDLDDDKAGSYQQDDFRVRVIAAYQADEFSAFEHPLSFNGQNSDAAVNSASADDFEVAIKLLGETWADGYAVELSYNYANYDRTFEEGSHIGFEVQICDDVNGFGNRDSQAFLGNPADTAHNNPSSFGADIVLTGAGTGEVAETAAETEAVEETVAETEAVEETVAEAEAAAEETEAETEAEVAAEEAVAEAVEETAEVTETAPQTFDAAVLFALLGTASGAALLLRKKN